LKVKGQACLFIFSGPTYFLGKMSAKTQNHTESPHGENSLTPESEQALLVDNSLVDDDGEDFSFFPTERRRTIHVCGIPLSYRRQDSTSY
jgi:hypothetical protein